MNTQCDRCQTPLGSWDYRYHGLHYCRTCYDSLFKVRTCAVCHQKKMIFTKLKIPVCKICQVKDASCIRCGKKDYAFGKITKYGAVCLSCAPYFREYKECTKCHIESHTVGNRTLQNGEVQLICGNCYNKTLPICHKCHKQRKAFSYDTNGHPVCKICTQNSDKICKECGELFPAGMGNICRNCTYSNSLEKRATFGSKTLSEYNDKLFYAFAHWLARRRGFLFASTSIQKYYSIFLKIDKYAQELGRYPSYLELISKLTSKILNKNSLVIIFLDEKKLLTIDTVIKEEYANRNRINKYLALFPKSSYHYKILNAYHKMLYQKYTMDKTTIRSIRLALTPAVKFLEYITYTEDKTISNASLQSYLWVYSGQKNAITGFINFLNKTYHLILKIPKEKATFRTPNKSKAQLKQAYISCLRDYESINHSKQYLLTLAIEYLHGIAIPKDTVLPLRGVKKKKNGDCYIRLAGTELYLPSEIYQAIHR